MRQNVSKIAFGDPVCRIPRAPLKRWLCRLQCEGSSRAGVENEAVELLFFLRGCGIGPEGGFLSDMLKKVSCPLDSEIRGWPPLPEP